ncbi:hypothetical protein [Streptomyces sp. NPDC037389]|uniref:hypothetical protein n=1 Tax=Streptomyces sp. NPDC037389 TaxID=3155369 RepID=UPI0033D0D6FB
MTDPTALRLTAPKALKVTLVGQDQPPLQPGTYTLSVDQPVKEGATTLGGLSSKQSFTLHAPRFALDPADVIAVHPPPTATGRFEMTLPHLVLARGGLPWSRRLTGDGQIPWVALLLLTDDDVLLNPDTREPVSGRTVKDLLRPPRNILAPSLTPVPDEALHGRPCQTLDLRADALTDVLPKCGELRWLAHVRNVYTEGQSQTTGSADTFVLGRRAVITTNRFPRTPSRRYTAVLVSLEGYASYTFLGGSTTPPSGTTAIRLAALWSWSFTTGPSTGDPLNSDFHALAGRLSAATATERLLRLPHSAGKDEIATHVARRLEGGHVPVTYRLPTGEHAPAWFRGPFTARPARRVPTGREALQSADAALIYLERYGAWDVSYACAYTLGQVLAAADPGLLRALEGYRADGLTAAQRSYRAPAATTGGGTDARARFQALVTRDLAKRIDEGLKKRDTGQAAPPADDRPVSGSQATWHGIGALERAVHALTVQPAANSGDGPADSPLSRALRTVAGDHTDAVAEALGPPVQWLSRVPFDHLVPHAGMLPEHSARFFQVDHQWMRALFAGLRSVGAVSYLDLHLDQLLASALAERMEPELPVFGGLVRSPLIRYWPDLIVEASKNGSSITMYTSRPLPDVLLLLCNKQQPDTVILREPPHGLSMGIDTMDSGGALNLRRPSGDTIGSPLGAQATGLNACVRGAGGRTKEVLRLTEGSEPMTEKVQAALRAALNDKGYALTPAGLALQLLNSAGQLRLVTS